MECVLKNFHVSIDVIAVGVVIESKVRVFCGFLDLEKYIMYSCKEQCYAKDRSLGKAIFSEINVRGIVMSFYLY